MTKQKLLVGAAIAVFSAFLSIQTANAQCASCNANSVDVFGYPSTGGGCTDCQTSGGFGASQRARGYSQISQRMQATQAHNSKVYARNLAWPKPFACASRQHYHNMWGAMYDAGWEEQCILTSTHFDPAGELTRFGKQQIGGMMMNMPKARRVIYVQETANPAETEARMAKVRNVIETWYGQRGGVVQVSARTPAMMSGTTAVDITEKALQGAPAPVIPIADSGAGVAGAIQ